MATETPEPFLPFAGDRIRVTKRNERIGGARWPHMGDGVTVDHVWWYDGDVIAVRAPIDQAGVNMRYANLFPASGDRWEAVE